MQVSRTHPYGFVQMCHSFLPTLGERLHPENKNSSKKRIIIVFENNEKISLHGNYIEGRNIIDIP